MNDDQTRNFSYTRCAKDDDCRRARYLSREFGGTGLVPTQSGWALVFGNFIHQGLEQLAKEGNIDYDTLRSAVAVEASQVFNVATARDWSVLAEGLLKGFVKSVWPGLRAEYNVEATEKWIEWEVEPGYNFRARQDLLLRSKFDGHLAYVDYKTTSSHKPQWIASWAKSVQLHSSMYALRKASGLDIQRAIVIGLFKGYVDKDSLQRSPFTYGWCNRQFSMMPEYKYEYTRGKGWELFNCAEEFPEGLDHWVANMPATLLSEQYPTTGPIFPRDDIAEKYFKQQLIREKEVDIAIKRLHESTSVEEITLILDTHFKQNFSKCEPAYGFKCEFAPLCWQKWVEEDPLGSGLYKPYEEIAVDE